MSKHSNNRFVTANKYTEKSNYPPYRKCAHHIHSHSYAANMRQHDEIVEKAADKIITVDMDSSIGIKVIFHFLAPRGTYNRDKVHARAYDIILSINDDFNNYSSNPNTMNNFKYKSVINQVFISNMTKQGIYLGKEYLKFLPTKPSNIIFELGEIYYYPVKHRLNMSQYDTFRDVEIMVQIIKQFIHQNRADAINPESLINIWIIDMVDTKILSFSNFPWEVIDNYHGIVIHRRVFSPEDYEESNFSTYKTFTHAIGHYLGLLHVFGQNSGIGAYGAVNINADSEKISIDYEPDGKEKFIFAHDPTDKDTNRRLHLDNTYNPLFMNFMDFTYDKYTVFFTNNQIQKMRYMAINFRPKMNFITNQIKLPIPKYNPDTDTMVGFAKSKYKTEKDPAIIPSYEPVNNPRLSTQDFITPNVPISSSNKSKDIPKFSENINPTVATSNAQILKLIPNLAANTNPMPTAANTKEQIIHNIQNSLPDFNTSGSSPDSIPASPSKPPNDYEETIKKYLSYHSSDGYSTGYPYDPYVMQEHNNNMASWYSHMQKQWANMAKQRDNASHNTKDTKNPFYGYSYPGDPRLMYPRFAYPMFDPRYLPRDPRFPYPVYQKQFINNNTVPEMKTYGTNNPYPMGTNQEAIKNIIKEYPNMDKQKTVSSSFDDPNSKESLPPSHLINKTSQIDRISNTGNKSPIYPDLETHNNSQKYNPKEEHKNPINLNDIPNPCPSSCRNNQRIPKRRFVRTKNS